MFHKVLYNAKKYCIMPVYFKKNKIPVVIDACNEKIISSVSNKWTCNCSGVISCIYNFNGNSYNIKLHELIMSISTNQNPNIDTQKLQNKIVIHINRMCLDNRIDNLMYDITEKDTTKNMKKKQRSVTLPPDSGISPDELPTYVWYVRPEGTHNDRFVINIGNVLWKSTSSSKVSLRYKLEESKAYLRDLKQKQPELFKTYSMNGDFNKKGEELLESFYAIIYSAGYDNIKKISLPNATDKYLQPCSLDSHFEKVIFNEHVTNNNSNNKHIIKLLPSDKHFTIGKLPEHTYYRPPTELRGGYFIVKNHPQYSGTWTTTTSKNISIIDKYKQLEEFLRTLPQNEM